MIRGCLQRHRAQQTLREKGGNAKGVKSSVAEVVSALLALNFNKVSICRDDEYAMTSYDHSSAAVQKMGALAKDYLRYTNPEQLKLCDVALCQALSVAPCQGRSLTLYTNNRSTVATGVFSEREEGKGLDGPVVFFLPIKIVSLLRAWHSANDPDSNVEPWILGMSKEIRAEVESMSFANYTGRFYGGSTWLWDQFANSLAV